ncbi:hypothetical protein Tco_0458214 [Tanacetum coccineum]
MAEEVGGKHCGGRGGGVGSNSGVGEGKEEFIGGIGGGSFAKRLMVVKDGLRGIVKKDYGKAENMSVGSASAILKRAPA